MDSKQVYLGLDIGEQRIGLALGDSIGRLAQPIATVMVDGTEAAILGQLISDHDVTHLVAGRPRNQSGDMTAQTVRVERFVSTVLRGLELPVSWQDESVTSVVAEERLLARKKPYTKADIDAEAATIILQDYLDRL
jgi:putative holliday junction resolvase